MLEVRRERERRLVARWLTVRRIGRLERRLAEWTPGDPNVTGWRKRLRRVLDRWPRRFEEERAHELRRRVRSLRYAVEAAPRPDRRLLDFLRRLQEVGGEWHDLVMIRDLLGGGFARELARQQARYLRGVHRVRKEVP
jgi:CHAD domain-containing protein